MTPARKAALGVLALGACVGVVFMARRASAQAPTDATATGGGATAAAGAAQEQNRVVVGSASDGSPIFGTGNAATDKSRAAVAARAAQERAAAAGLGTKK